MGLAGIWLGLSIASALLVWALHFLIENTSWEQISDTQNLAGKKKGLVTTLLDDKKPSKKKSFRNKTGSRSSRSREYG